MCKDNGVTLNDFFMEYVPPANKAAFITIVKQDYDGRLNDIYDKGMLIDILNEVQLTNKVSMGF